MNKIKIRFSHPFQYDVMHALLVTVKTYNDYARLICRIKYADA